VDCTTTQGIEHRYFQLQQQKVMAEEEEESGGEMTRKSLDARQLSGK
jgi:hypothetical protein